MPYKPFKTLSDPLDGATVAEITVQDTALGGKRYTFALKRDYIVSEGTKRTNYFLKRHIGALKQLLDEVEKELTAAEEDSKQEQRKHLEEQRK